jgi:hypothetical protein
MISLQQKTKIYLKKERTVVIIYQPATRILSHQIFNVLKRMRVENRFKKSTKIPLGAWRLETTATAKNSNRRSYRQKMLLLLSK